MPEVWQTLGVQSHTHNLYEQFPPTDPRSAIAGGHGGGRRLRASSPLHCPAAA